MVKKAREDTAEDGQERRETKRNAEEDGGEQGETERSWKKKKLRWLKTISKIPGIAPYQ